MAGNIATWLSPLITHQKISTCSNIGVTMPTQTLTLTNFDSGNITAQSQLTSNIAAAVSSLPVDNTADFVTTNFVLIGVIGSNVAELGAITGITDPTDIATTSPTKVAHTQYLSLIH